MIRVTVKNRNAVAVALSPVTSGAVGLPVRFSFSEDWMQEGITRMACFKAQEINEEYSLLLDETNECEVPWELLATDGYVLFAGAYGENGAGTKVIPTVWAEVGMIEKGTGSGEPPEDPTPSQWAQIRALAQEAADLAEHQPIIQNNYWYFWDEEEGEYINSGVKAQGVDGPKGDKGDKGDPGEPGAKGDKGDKGDTGTGLKIIGTVATVQDLPATAPVSTFYNVGTSAPYTVYLYDGTNWVSQGQLQGPKGEKGDTGDTGSQGPKGDAGDDGVSPTVEIASITGGHSVTITDAGHPSGQSFNVLDGVKGDKGDKGDTGETGSQGPKGDTGDTGQTGPQGIQGQKGDAGDDGVSPTVTITPVTGGNSITITDAEHPSGQTFNVMNGVDGQRGPQGYTGVTPDFSIGAVTTGAAGSSAAANITGTAEEPVLNLTIPQGLKGDPGNGSMIADDFSVSEAYEAGEYVIYNGSLYRFETAHAAGAWVGTDAQEVSLADDVTATRNTLNSEIATRQTYVRPNLLDNWYFVGGGSQLGDGVFPINQRGQTIYNTNGAFTIDRFRILNNNSSVEIKTDCLRVSGNALVAQRIEPFSQFIGKTVTLAALISGELISRSFVVTETTDEQIQFNTQSGYIGFHFRDGIRLRVLSGYIDFIAVKLELGSGQTLAHNEGTEENPVWVLNEIPDYGEQLRRCQRYLQLLYTNIRLRSAARFTSNGNTILDFYYRLSPEMHNSPSFSNATWNMTPYGGGSNVASEYSYSVANTTTAVLNIRATKSGTDGLIDAQLFSYAVVYISCEP